VGGTGVLVGALVSATATAVPMRSWVGSAAMGALQALKSSSAVIISKVFFMVIPLCKPDLVESNCCIKYSMVAE
jgi:hypothetical protein